MAETVKVPVDGVAVTAIGVAVIRARESEREDRLYVDPQAKEFVEAARAGFAPDRWARMEALADQFYAGRTIGVRLVDDRFRQAIEAGCRQIVLLGAGLDTRAYRMGLSEDIHVFEIDLPELFDFKEPVLAASGATPTCHRHVVVADLREDWRKPLLASGFQPSVPTCWVDEGSLGYLNQDWNQRVVRTLTELSAPGSRFGAGRMVVDPDAPQYRELRAFVAGDSAPAQIPTEHTADFDVERWLDEIGWDTEFHSWNDMTAHLPRPAGTLDPRIGTIAAVRR
ncbi:SAM-dependent methyltransferase [Nocardia sp. CDC153]|uniref:SAM-dependent methyltransferase n=1 Tax=Nocardia sp. CDC153 TaxID=3112167 RepID=UPI002DB84618|nr:SAM-dependent methyltransferase [Nocardia sp. CDC153]MEC3954622.1 SAM-dependent methyltransferase [Nocardia sp. CDC153]